MLKNAIGIDLDVISECSSLFRRAFKTQEKKRKGVKLDGPAVLSRRVGIKVPASLFRSMKPGGNCSYPLIP